MHRLLEKQLKTLNLAPGLLPDDAHVWHQFIDFIDQTYQETEREQGLLEKRATHDPLTGLANRMLLLDRIQHAISVESRHGGSFGILYFDLDRFKLINDSLTHQIGDELLQAVATRLRSTFRLEDTVARVGGDEFVMLALDLEEETAIVNIANKLLDLFQNAFPTSIREIPITSSIGISIYPKDGETAEELLSKADIAMYHAKETGSNHFQFYTPELNHLSGLRLKKEDSLRHAIEKKQFFLVYQPQFDMVTRKITCVEALLRWNHPQKGVLYPSDFLLTAEETGLIIPIGQWVMKKACEQNKAWQDRGLPAMRVAVNVSSVELSRPNFLAGVKNTLKKTGLKPEFLEIELSENVLLSHPGIVKITEELHKMGIQVSLDDFGVGNSGLNHLKTIHAHRLKIDQIFIKNIGIDKQDEAMINAMIDLARGLNYKILAEGVETEAQLNFLKDKHCESIQGFLLGEPMVAEDFEIFFNHSQ